MTSPVKKRGRGRPPKALQAKNNDDPVVEDANAVDDEIAKDNENEEVNQTTKQRTPIGRKTKSAASSTGRKKAQASNPINEQDEQDEKNVDHGNGDGKKKPIQSSNRTKSDNDTKSDNNRDSSSSAIKEDTPKKDADNNNPRKNTPKRKKDEVASNSFSKKSKPTFTCPHCNKVITSEKRLQNHLDKKVCQNIPKKSSDKVETTPPIAKKSSKPKSRRKSAPAAIKQSESPPDVENEGVNGATENGADDGGKKKMVSVKNESNDHESVVPVLERSCPHCSTILSTTAYLQYHLRHQICLREKSQRSFKLDTAPFHKLEPGSQFVTRYGAVEVIVDDRLPLVHHKKVVTGNDSRRCRVIERKRVDYDKKQAVVRNQIAVGARRRRDALQQMYLVSTTDPNTGSKAISQRKVWDMYCKSLTPTQILDEQLSWGCMNKDLKDRISLESLDVMDPMEPADCYPDRIVECKLIKDKRRKITNTHISSCNENEIDELEESDTEMTLKPKEVNSTKELEPKQNQLTVRLFIKRRELIQQYNPLRPSYTCSECRQSFTYGKKYRSHTRNRICSTFRSEAKMKNQQCIEAIEKDALCKSKSKDTFLTMVHAAIKPKPNEKVVIATGSVEIEWGNPHNIKEHKKHKWPPWMVFNAQRSSIYAEVFISMGFKRGANNSKWCAKLKLEEGYILAHERLRLRRYERRKMTKRTRIEDHGVNSMHALHGSDYDCSNSLGSTNGSRKQSKRARITNIYSPNYHASSMATNSRAIFMKTTGKNGDGDRSGIMAELLQTSNENEDETFENSYFEDTPSNVYQLEMPRKIHESSNQSSASIEDESGDMRKDDQHEKRQKKRGSLDEFLKAKKNPVVVDVQVLAEECEAGRYPSVTRFLGDHEGECVLCRKKGPASDGENPLIDCDFCKNSAHQNCIDRKMLQKDPPVVLRESEPHDSLMCHDCLSICLARRVRAENRRLSKWHHELSKTGLQQSSKAPAPIKRRNRTPDAANLTEEINLDVVEETKECFTEAKDDDEPTYMPCPSGGPGGLICCSRCTAAYSRILSNTAKEMEAQSVAKVGQEVSEVLELLADAKKRLLNVTDVSRANDFRRSLFRNTEGAFNSDPSLPSALGFSLLKGAHNSSEIEKE